MDRKDCERGFYADVTMHLQTMQTASNLSDADFAEFVSLFDLSGTGQRSRFATKAEVISKITGVLGDDVSSEVSVLRTRIQDAMLPEAHRDVITEKILLTWFDLGAREGLFPAPADITLPAQRISRPAAGKTIDSMTAGNRLFFYSSGRSSNEAGFVFQLLARAYGTNNVNNCSYYCHQATSEGLATTIGKGTSTRRARGPDRRRPDLRHRRQSRRRTTRASSTC